MMDHEGVPLSVYPTVKALYAYNARSDRELTFGADDVLTVLDITCETWWQGAFNGRKGYIPAAYVEHTPCDEDGDAGPAPPAPVEASSGDAEVQPEPHVPVSSYSQQSAAVAAAAPPPPPPAFERDPSPPARNPSPPPPPVPPSFDEDAGSTPNESPVASPMTRTKSSGAADRPDLAKALRIHQAKAKHKDLQPKGTNEIQAQLHRMKSKHGEQKKDEDELSKAMREQRHRLDSASREQERFANMSELEKRFAQKKTEQ